MNFDALPVSMPYFSTAELRIYCMTVFLTYYDMEQDLRTNKSKYEVWESISSMDMLQERSLMIDHIEVI